MSKEIKHISGAAGGYLVGNSHKDGGIQAINKAIGKPLEMEGGEVVITKPAVEDNELREFEGEMLTNRQILSKINESGGGVSFAELGAELPTQIEFCGTEYKYGGETLTDYEIAHRISKCGCNHEEESYADGGNLEKDLKENAINVAVNATETLPLMEKGGKTSDNEFNYMMLSRLKTDNDYFLGNGNRNSKHLWATNVEDQITEMKRLWNILPVKPEWLSMEDILNYEKQMTDLKENESEELEKVSKKIL